MGTSRFWRFTPTGDRQSVGTNSEPRGTADMVAARGATTTLQTNVPAANCYQIAALTIASEGKNMDRDIRTSVQLEL